MFFFEVVCNRASVDQAFQCRLIDTLVQTIRDVTPTFSPDLRPVGKAKLPVYLIVFV
jgi:hypothetical protein